MLSDRFGRTPTFAAMFAFQCAVMLMLGHLNGAIALCLAVAAVGFNFGGSFAVFPSATADFFGAKHLGANYGWLFTAYGLAGVLGIAAGNAAKIMTGSYTAAFTLAASLCLLSTILSWVVGRMPDPASASISPSLARTA
jgi:OFA family oxalate/formate antiporter-like MFS transporter